MDLNDLERQVTEEYDLFLTALNGRYLQALQPGHAPTPRDVVEFSAWAMKARDALRERMSNKAAELVTTLEEGADVGSVAQLRALLGEYQNELARITADNVRSVVIALRVGRDTLGQMFTKEMGAAMGQLLAAKIKRIEFKVADPAGRKWDSGRYLAFVVREFAYRLKLNKQLSDLGGGLAEVFYPDHEEDGMVFSVLGDYKSYPSFKDLEKTVFHPNSKAEVVRHAAA